MKKGAGEQCRVSKWSRNYKSFSEMEHKMRVVLIVEVTAKYTLTCTDQFNMD